MSGNGRYSETRFERRGDAEMGQLTYAERYGWSSAWSTVNLFLGSNVCGGRRCIRDVFGRKRQQTEAGRDGMVMGVAVF